jgi:Putative zinc-finger
MKHLTTADLADHVEGRTAGPEARRRLEAHLTTCPRCAQALAGLEGVIGAMRTDRSPEPPAHVLARAIELYEPALDRPTLASRLAGLKEVLGKVVFDSLADPAFAAARGSLAARRLRFETGGYELDLAIERRQGRFSLLGQLATQARGGEARALSGAQYLVLAGEEALAEGTTDGLGEFTVEVGALEHLTIALLAPPEAVLFAVPPRGAPAVPGAPGAE